MVPFIAPLAAVRRRLTGPVQQGRTPDKFGDFSSCNSPHFSIDGQRFNSSNLINAATRDFLWEKENIALIPIDAAVRRNASNAAVVSTRAALTGDEETANTLPNNYHLPG